MSGWSAGRTRLAVAGVVVAAAASAVVLITGDRASKLATQAPESPTTVAAIATTAPVTTPQAEATALTVGVVSEEVGRTPQNTPITVQHVAVVDATSGAAVRVLHSASLPRRVSGLAVSPDESMVYVGEYENPGTGPVAARIRACPS